MLLVFVHAASAHRLDEYLQTSRVAVERDRVALELDVTPGAAIAAQVVTTIDRDADGRISPVEAEAYGRAVVRELFLEVDGRAVPLTLTRVEASTIEEMIEGLGSIQLTAVGQIREAGTTRRRILRFRNDHHPDSSAYLVNAMVPLSRGVAVTSQMRDVRQREVRLEYEVRAVWATRLTWLTLGLSGVGVLIVSRLRWGGPKASR
jgi:hypothetical protein